MNRTQTSTTARGIAATRALETEKGAAAICTDPFARRFTTRPFYLLLKLFGGYGERRSPGTQGYIVSRCRFLDDFLDDRLQSGVDQVVILGAGLDSRAYRTRTASGHARFFELDHPATQADKLRRVREIFGTAPENVVYVPIDFNTESLDKLTASGLDISRPTLFLWEGVTYYLEPDAVDATLGWIRGHAPRGSMVIFDYVHRAALTGAVKPGDVTRMQRYSRFTGEKLVFGVEKGEIFHFLTSRGFRGPVDVTADELMRRYCVGPNANRVVADTYAIAYAEV